MATRKKQKGKLSGLNADGSPNAYWRRFKERLDTYSDTPVKDWKAEQILGHILKRYKDQMGIEFALSYSGPPTKCKEIYCTKRMILALGTEDGQTAKNYVDWVFDSVIIPGKVSISSVAYFFTPSFIFRFKADRRRKLKISRTTELPPDIRSVVEELSLDVKTYGDLAFAKVAIDDDPDNEELSVYFRLFMDLKQKGFDESVLSTLEH